MCIHDNYHQNLLVYVNPRDLHCFLLAWKRQNALAELMSSRSALVATAVEVLDGVYGRAWRNRRRLLASTTTRTVVDVLWILWFR